MFPAELRGHQPGDILTNLSWLAQVLEAQRRGNDGGDDRLVSETEGREGPPQVVGVLGLHLDRPRQAGGIDDADTNQQLTDESICGHSSIPLIQTVSFHCQCVSNPA
jgi:hypothetical protein